MKIQRLIIAGGGTGGHIYPGVAIAEEIRRRCPDAQIAFIGTARGLENKILPPLGYPLELVTATRLKGGTVAQKMLGLLRLPRAIWQSWRIIRRYRPQVVVGVGGYASGPALIAAWVTRYRTAIQEQNAAPGLTNRWLGRIVKRIFVGFEAATARFPAKKVIFTGNPLRLSIAARLGTTESTRAPNTLALLVFGGSQGARFLNEEIPGLLTALKAANPGLLLTVTHQTGQAEVDLTSERYAELRAAGVPVDVKPFIHDMPAAYRTADLAICRAGALTLAELAAVGLPSILVPFPHAADNHQEANARVLEAAGAAIVATQASWAPDALVKTIEGLAASPDALTAMGTRAADLAHADAAVTLVNHLEALAA